MAEGTLRRWEGALIIVSHDRYFLDRVVNRLGSCCLATRRPNPRLSRQLQRHVAQRREAWERAERSIPRRRRDWRARWLHPPPHCRRTDRHRWGRLRQLTRDLALIEEVGWWRWSKAAAAGKAGSS